MYRAGNSVEQVFGGTVIKQGDQTPLGFNFRDENGQLVSLLGATVQVKIASNKGVVVEKQATISDGYTVTFSLGQDDITGSGNMMIEFIVTYSGGTQEKFPSDDWQRIRITPTLEDVEKYGVGYITFEQMKADMDEKYIGFQNQLDSIVADAGNSNLEIVQARTAEDGTTFNTLKALLDDKGNKIGNRVSIRNSYTFSSITSWLAELEERLFDGGINIRSRKYGAVGDGVSRPIYSSNPNSLSYQAFTTLSAMQAKYTMLTNTFLSSIGIDPTTTAWQTLELDWCALQQAIKEGEWINVPKGTFRINKNLDAYGARMKGFGRGQTKIIQYNASEAVITPGSVAILTDLYFGHSTLPTDQTVPNGVGINLHKYGLADGAVLQRLYVENNTSGIYLGDDSTAHVYSSTFSDIRITRFTHSAMYIGGFGHTGCNLLNLYANNWDNYSSQTKLSATFGFVFKGYSEGNILQINLEHGLYSKGIVFSADESNFVSGVHFEGYVANSNYGYLIGSEGTNSSLRLFNVSIVYSTFDNAKAPIYSLLNIGRNSKVKLDGFMSRDNTVIGSPTLRKCFGDGTIMEGASVEIEQYNSYDNLFSAADYFPISPQIPILKRLNHSRYYWEEGGKGRFVGTGIPTTGYWTVGSKKYETAPVAGGYEGYICTDAGHFTPATGITTTVGTAFVNDIIVSDYGPFKTGDRFTIVGSSRTFKLTGTYKDAQNAIHFQLDINIEVAVTNAELRYVPPIIKGFGAIQA
jgi:hypothetical protein